VRYKDIVGIRIPMQDLSFLRLKVPHSFHEPQCLSQDGAFLVEIKVDLLRDLGLPKPAV
jgi:hypothetical protein